MKKYGLFLVTVLILFLTSYKEKDGQYYYEKADNQIIHAKYDKGVKSAGKAESLFLYDDYRWREVIVLEGETYLWMNETDKAIKEFNRVFKFNSEDEDVVLNIVATCFRTQHHEVLKQFCEFQLKSNEWSSKSQGLLNYYLAHLAFANKDYVEYRQLLASSNERFLRAEFSKYDEDIKTLRKNRGLKNAND